MLKMCTYCSAGGYISQRWLHRLNSKKPFSNDQSAAAPTAVSAVIIITSLRPRTTPSARQLFLIFCLDIALEEFYNELFDVFVQHIYNRAQSLTETSRRWKSTNGSSNCTLVEDSSLSPGKMRVMAEKAKELGLFSAFPFNFALIIAFASFPRNLTISASLHFSFFVCSYVSWFFKITWRSLKIFNLEEEKVIISDISFKVYFQRQMTFLTFILRRSVGHTTKYLHCSHL